jgi:hypothetical protein
MRGATHTLRTWFPQQSRAAMLAGEMMTWWLSGGADAQGQSTAQLPCPLFFFFLFQAPT